MPAAPPSSPASLPFSRFSRTSRGSGPGVSRRSPGASGRRAAVVAASALALGASLAGAAPAQATWQFSAATLIDIRHACRDGLQVGVAVVGTEAATADIPTRVVAAQPPPGEWTERPPLAVSHPVTLTRLPAPRTVPVGDSGDPSDRVSITHLRTVTVPLARGQAPLALGPVAVSGNPDLSQSTVNTATVTDCRLFAPIDIEPGNSSNAVALGRRGRVTVAVLGTPTMRAERLRPATFRFGPRSARPLSSAVRDVNRDGRRDLVLRFGSADAGLTCRTRAGTLVGTTPSGGYLQGSARISPRGCR